MSDNLRELTDDEISILFQLEKMDEDQRSGLFDHIKSENDGGWILQAVEKHCKARGLKVDKAVQIMICTHGEAIGKCVKLIDTVYDWCLSNNTKNATFEDYKMKIFPHGVPIF